MFKAGSSIKGMKPEEILSQDMKNYNVDDVALAISQITTMDYEEIEKICSDNGLLIYEHLNNQEMTNTYFSSFNILHPSSKIIAPNGISYCLAVKK